MSHLNKLNEQLIDAQTASLEKALREKTIHRTHRRTLELDGISRGDLNLWLCDGRVKAATKALIMAAQDGTLPTKQYVQQVWAMETSVNCRKCGKTEETIGQILSSCNEYKWGRIRADTTQ